jgi:competence protein CoiA
VVARCGEVRFWHWAHKGRRLCDPWWKNETEWHRTWKNEFPTGWQEFPQQAVNGERHVADVRTDGGLVIEFQHLRIEPDERRSREAFYQRLVWVVDGKTRKRDKAQILRAISGGTPLEPYSNKSKISSHGSALLRDWAGSRAHVFIDFGEPTLWWLSPESDDTWAYVRPFSRAELVKIHRQRATDREREF